MWKKWLYSSTLLALPRSKRVAYIGVVTAFTVIANAMFELKFFGVQFSLTIFITALAGVVLGAAPGFLAGFMGDLIGFMLHPFGEYSPWIGISTGLMAVIAALIIRLPMNIKGGVYLKFLYVSVWIFFVCTAGINTIYLHRVWYQSMSYKECLVTRLFVEGQFWNTLANSVLLIAVTPMLAKVKPLKLKIR